MLPKRVSQQASDALAESEYLIRQMIDSVPARSLALESAATLPAGQPGALHRPGLQS